MPKRRTDAPDLVPNLPENAGLHRRDSAEAALTLPTRDFAVTLTDIKNTDSEMDGPSIVCYDGSGSYIVIIMTAYSFAAAGSFAKSGRLRTKPFVNEDFQELVND